MCEVLDDLQSKAGLDIPVHVDAASGRFLAPFITPELMWDFRIDRVKSINASGHKFGLSPFRCRLGAMERQRVSTRRFSFNVNYLGGDMPTFALNFSRPGGQIVAQYYNFIHLGFEGYKEIHQQCYNIAKYIAKSLTTMGIFEIISDGDNGIPAVSWSMKADKPYSLFDISEKFVLEVGKLQLT